MVSGDDATRRLKRAELLSTVGAGVLGAGIGLLLAEHLVRYAVAMLIVGIIVHGWGMFDKRRLENERSGTRGWWFDVLYWVCWAMLAALLLVVLLGRL